MRDEVFGFLVAGHDTTGAVMEWTLKWLTTDQGVQARLRSELHSVLRKHPRTDDGLTAENICKAKVCSRIDLDADGHSAYRDIHSCHISMP